MTNPVDVMTRLKGVSARMLVAADGAAAADLDARPAATSTCSRSVVLTRSCKVDLVGAAKLLFDQMHPADASPSLPPISSSLLSRRGKSSYDMQRRVMITVQAMVMNYA